MRGHRRAVYAKYLLDMGQSEVSDEVTALAMSVRQWWNARRPYWDPSSRACRKNSDEALPLVLLFSAVLSFQVLAARRRGFQMCQECKLQHKRLALQHCAGFCRLM